MSSSGERPRARDLRLISTQLKEKDKGTHGVSSGHGAVDVDSEARVAGLDVARDGDLGRVRRAAAGDFDLRTADVPLRRFGDVQPDLLDADEILQVGGGSR